MEGEAGQPQTVFQEGQAKGGDVSELLRLGTQGQRFDGGEGLHNLLGDGRQGEALQPLHRHVQAVSSREVLDDDEAGLGGAEQPR